MSKTIKLSFIFSFIFGLVLGFAVESLTVAGKVPEKVKHQTVIYA